MTRIGPPGPSVGDGGGAAAVVNVDVKLAARALLATSFTRGSEAPPRIVNVYVFENPRPKLGVNMAGGGLLTKDTGAETSGPGESRSSTVDVLIVAGSIASLKVALTLVETST